MPTTAQHTWSANTRLDPIFDAGRARVLNVALAASTTYARGTVLGEVTATPGTYKPYANANVDGSQTAKGVLAYACVTDASGNLTLIGEHGVTQKHAPMYMPGSGYFKTSELVGMDAAAMVELGASLVAGDLTSGIIQL
jgi:hypothetical protein